MIAVVFGVNWKNAVIRIWQTGAQDMKIIYSLLCFILIFPFTLSAQERSNGIRKNIPLDSIRLSDPCILADAKTAMYYMTGTGGMLWKSKDLKFWEGPFQVVKTDPASWMGPHPMIWAAELHEYRSRYTRRIPHLFEVDDSGDKLIVREPYIP